MSVSVPALQDDDSLATTLMCILIDAYEEELFDMDMLDLIGRVKKDFNIQLSESAENKVNAAIVSMTTDLALRDPAVFRAVALAFNEGTIGNSALMAFDDDYTDEDDADEADLTSPELLWTLTEMSTLRGCTMDDLISDIQRDVRKYIEGVIKDEVEDREEIDPEVDTIEEAADEDAFTRYVSEMQETLQEQVGSLGYEVDL
ncbi:MAG: hypothetical protein RR182_00455 [Alistipes sp.]